MGDNPLTLCSMTIFRLLLNCLLGFPSVDAFEQKLFQGCITGSTNVMWTKYHTLRTSDEFHQVWNSFIQINTQCTTSPMFNQYVGHHIFKGIIKATFMPLNKSNAMSSSDDLTYAETNAIRYAAGYVLRALKKRISRSENANKVGLMLCLDVSD